MKSVSIEIEQKRAIEFTNSIQRRLVPGAFLTMALKLQSATNQINCQFER